MMMMMMKHHHYYYHQQHNRHQTNQKETSTTTGRLKGQLSWSQFNKSYKEIRELVKLSESSFIGHHCRLIGHFSMANYTQVQRLVFQANALSLFFHLLETIALAGGDHPNAIGAKGCLCLKLVGTCELRIANHHKTI